MEKRRREEKNIRRFHKGIVKIHITVHWLLCDLAVSDLVSDVLILHIVCSCLSLLYWELVSSFCGACYCSLFQVYYRIMLSYAVHWDSSKKSFFFMV